MFLTRHLWLKIGVPIGVLTFFAIGFAVLAIADEMWLGATLAGLAAFLGAATIVFTYRSLAPLEDVTDILEGIAEGDLEHERLDQRRDDEIGRLARSTNHMTEKLNELSDTAEELARGDIDVVDAERRVLDSGRLADADVEPTDDHGDLERSFIRMTNHMRRLTIQARVIARDDLYNELLDEEVPGELGESFALMVNNLRTIADRAKDIAEGDLTSYVEGDGELTTAFNQMVTGLNELVQQIVETAIHISSASEQILVVLQDQELAANHQASGVEETQRTMETLLASARKIADNSKTVYKSAEKTQANNRTVAERIGELKSHTNRITEILEVIKSIADRSDLLALNAGLEGMRAGEAGKGFTLVAAEMRRLAENIKESIGDIKELVSDIRESSMATVMATEEGSRLSEQTTETALQISLITQQQKSGTEQVTQSMEELSELINQGVAGTRQVTTAARDLADAADNLRTLVDEFEVVNAPDDDRRRQRRDYQREDRRRESPLSDFDPRSTLTRAEQFARRARETEATPSVPGNRDELAEMLDDTDTGNDTPAATTPPNTDGDVEDLDAPTVEFSSHPGSEQMLDELSSNSGKPESGDADTSREFKAIARDIEESGPVESIDDTGHEGDSESS